VALTLDDVRALAAHAHEGQTDKLGRDYYSGHLEPIAAALAEHGPLAEMAGLLHDVLEDTDLTAADLLERGVPGDVVRAVESVSKREGESYEELIARAAADPLGRLVKLADNAHNLASNAELARTDPEAAARLRVKYETARRTLLSPPAQPQ
jgi:(p)ppGpp synthase/HD superfamily hydrolase